MRTTILDTIKERRDAGDEDARHIDIYYRLNNVSNLVKNHARYHDACFVPFRNYRIPGRLVSDSVSNIMQFVINYVP